MLAYIKLVFVAFAASLLPFVNLSPVVIYAQATDTTSPHKIYLPVVSVQSNDAMTTNNEPVIDGLDPKHVPSEQERAAIAEVDARAQQHLKELTGEVQAAYLKLGKILALEKEWKEPEDGKYDNYCGPGATQVALDIRLPAQSVPGIDQLGKEESTNVGKKGTNLQDVCRSSTNTWGLIRVLINTSPPMQAV